MLFRKPNGHKKLKNRDTALHFALAVSLSLLCTCSAGTENLSNPNATKTSSTTSEKAANNANLNSAGTRSILRVYDECTHAEGGFSRCLKKKAIYFMDRISHVDSIFIADGIKVTKLPDAGYSAIRPLVNDNELESHLARAAIDRDTKLTNMLIDRLSNFFNGHTLQVNFPKLTSEEIGRGLEEGRGKMKKMVGMMMMGMAMKMIGMIPIAMGMLYMLAGKALIISKIALLLAGIMGLKKLMSGRGGSSGGSSGWSSGGSSGGWSSGGGGGGSGGWDRRSINEAHNLAYRGYERQQQQQDGTVAATNS